MLADWLQAVEDLSCVPAQRWLFDKKILHRVTAVFPRPVDDVTLEHIGYSRTHKLRQLRRNYLHEESRAAAVAAWNTRLADDSYGSVGFHCFNHAGPCIQSVVLTALPAVQDDITHATCDVHYRSVELFKKFPADLAFFFELLEPFDFSHTPLTQINCLFSNLSCDPMCYAVPLGLMPDPLGALLRLKVLDPKFHDSCVRWTARMLDDKFAGNIAKWASAQRVKDTLLEQCPPERLDLLREYMKENYDA